MFAQVREVSHQQWVSSVASQKTWEGSKKFWGAKMLDFRQITLFCFGNRLLKHKMTKCSENFGGHAPPGYGYAVGDPVRTFYIEQMFVLVRMQFHNHVDTQPVKRFERAMRCTVYTISNLECCTCARMRFHCANALVVLRSCAP